ncbi:TagK domain-containing protein [Burkholderia sp. YIM B11467]
MRSFRQPWRRQPDISHDEPLLDGNRERQTPDVEDHDLPDYEVVDHPRSNDDVLVDLGIGGMDRADAHVRTPANADGSDSLVETLHAQYWRALTDPHASVAADLMPPGDQPTSHAHAPDPQVDPGVRDACDSIEVLLRGNPKLEDVFEQLDRHAGHILDDEPVPEILRLFAPPEFHAAAARQGSALPPPLTRREHHALSVDSPLSAPERRDEG